MKAIHGGANAKRINQHNYVIIVTLTVAIVSVFSAIPNLFHLLLKFKAIEVFVL